MLEAARQTMMTFGESILEIDDDDDDDYDDNIGAEGDASTNSGSEGHAHGDQSNKKNTGNDTNTHTRHRKGPLRVVAYLVKRWLSTTHEQAQGRNTT